MYAPIWVWCIVAAVIGANVGHWRTARDMHMHYVLIPDDDGLEQIGDVPPVRMHRL